jgi:imidazoleglycerol phosphate synthase glutamine amidotransferase subunit HisH
MSAKIELNIPKGTKTDTVVSNLVEEIRVASQIRDGEKMLSVILGICLIVNTLDEMKGHADGLRILATAVQGGSTLEVKEYAGTDYLFKIE